MSSYNLPKDAPVDERFTAFLQSVKPLNLYSQHGEDGILAAIFERIGTANKWCFECGAADGLFFSNTRRLIEQDWFAVLVECDGSDFTKLRERYADAPRVCLMQAFLVADKRDNLTEITLDGVLARFRAPEEIDLVVLDIDSQEYYIVNSLTAHRPRVLVVEYDPLAEPMFIPELRGNGQAGLMAMRYVCESRGYEVIGRTPTNLICVRKDLAPMLMHEGSESPKPSESPKCSGCGVIPGKYALANLKPQHSPDNRIFGTEFCSVCGNAITWAELPPNKPVQAKTSPKKQQVFAAGRWQDADGQVEVADEAELEAAKAGKLPARTLVSDGPRKINIALCLSVPRLGFLDAFYELMSVVQRAGLSINIGFGVFWHHSLSRSIKNALECTEIHHDFILTADYDTFTTPEDLLALAKLLAEHPEADCIVPLQAKRGIESEILATFDKANLYHDLIPITSGHFGFTLFRREFFERMPKPWFWEKADTDGDWGSEDKGRIDADMGFWRNAAEAGLKTCLAPGIVIGHGEEMVSYPVIEDGKVRKTYQTVNDWLRSRTKPEGIGVR